MTDDTHPPLDHIERDMLAQEAGYASYRDLVDSEIGIDEDEEDYAGYPDDEYDYHPDHSIDRIQYE